MTDRQSEPQDPASSDEPRSVDTETRFLKTLSAVFKDYRDVLPRLPELTEQCLNNEPLDPGLAESRLKNNNRTSVERELKEKDKLLQESERKAKCLDEECSKLKKELEKREKEISEREKEQGERVDSSSKRLEKWSKEQWQAKEKQLRSKQDDRLFEMRKHFEQQLKDSTEILQKNNTELQNLLRESTDIASQKEKENEALTKKLRECERQLQDLINSSPKDSRDTDRVDYSNKRVEKWWKEQWQAKEKQLIKKQDDRQFEMRKHYEQQLKDSTEILQKNNTELQDLLRKSTDIASQKGEEIEALKKKLRECERQLQEKINASPKDSRDMDSYKEQLVKTKQTLEENRKELERIKERHASFSERRVSSDQRQAENTPSTNRQSQLESEYVTEFKDGTRVDAIDIITTRVGRYRGSQISSLEYLKCCRLACFIFEIAYEVVVAVQESFAAFTCTVIEMLTDDAPLIGSDSKAFQNKIWKLQFSDLKETQHTSTQDALSEVMILVKERAKTYDLNFLVQHVKSSVASRWNGRYRDTLLLDYDSILLQGLNDYIKYCTQFAWCAVTQVPPLKIDYSTTAYSPRSHTISQAFSFTEERSPTRSPVRSESRTILCYLWPTLQDYDGKVIRKGEVVLNQ